MDSINDGDYSIINAELDRLESDMEAPRDPPTLSQDDVSAASVMPSASLESSGGSGVWSFNQRLLEELREERERSAGLSAEVSRLRQRLTELQLPSSLGESSKPTPSVNVTMVSCSSTDVSSHPYEQDVPSESHLAQLVQFALREMEETKAQLSRESADLQSLEQSVSLRPTSTKVEPPVAVDGIFEDISAEITDPTRSKEAVPAEDSGAVEDKSLQYEMPEGDFDFDSDRSSPASVSGFHRVAHERECPVCLSEFAISSSRSQAAYEAHVDMCAEESRAAEQLWECPVCRLDLPVGPRAPAILEAHVRGHFEYPE